MRASWPSACLRIHAAVVGSDSRGVGSTSPMPSWSLPSRVFSVVASFGLGSTSRTLPVELRGGGAALDASAGCAATSHTWIKHASVPRCACRVKRRSASDGERRDMAESVEVRLSPRGEK